MCVGYLHLFDSHEADLGRVASALDCVSVCGVAVCKRVFLVLL